MTLNEIIDAIGVEPYYQEPSGVIYCADCLDILPKIPEKSIDLVLTDPPYGIKITRSTNTLGVSPNTGRKATNDSWDDKIPSDNCFDEIFRCSDNQIVFGANYFWDKFYSTSCYLIWDKRGSLPDVPFCDTEFVWTSFTKKPSKRYLIRNHGFIRDSKDINGLHPTQKPSELMRVIIKDFSKSETDIILDPFLGSGTTAVAAKQLGRKFIGIEISEKYCQIAKERLAQEELF